MLVRLLGMGGVRRWKQRRRSHCWKGRRRRVWIIGMVLGRRLLRCCWPRLKNLLRPSAAAWRSGTRRRCSEGRSRRCTPYPEGLRRSHVGGSRRPPSSRGCRLQDVRLLKKLLRPQKVRLQQRRGGRRGLQRGVYVLRRKVQRRCMRVRRLLRGVGLLLGLRRSRRVPVGYRQGMPRRRRSAPGSRCARGSRRWRHCLAMLMMKLKKRSLRSSRRGGGVSLPNGGDGFGGDAG